MKMSKEERKIIFDTMTDEQKELMVEICGEYERKGFTEGVIYVIKNYDMDVSNDSDISETDPDPDDTPNCEEEDTDESD